MLRKLLRIRRSFRRNIDMILFFNLSNVYKKGFGTKIIFSLHFAFNFLKNESDKISELVIVVKQTTTPQQFNLVISVTVSVLVNKSVV